MKKVIILGTSRTDGETKNLVSKIQEYSDYDLIDLNEYTISQYDYEHKNKDDDFIPLMRKILENYEVLIFATPVYWYAMSGVLKMFFDRFTDLITIEKDLGRKLRGKYMAVVTSSYGNNLGEDFWIPFKGCAEYLGMKYITDLHTTPNDLDEQKIQNFSHLIDATA